MVFKSESWKQIKVKFHYKNQKEKGKATLWNPLDHYDFGSLSMCLNDFLNIMLNANANYWTYINFHL